MPTGRQKRAMQRPHRPLHLLIGHHAPAAWPSFEKTTARPTALSLVDSAACATAAASSVLKGFMLHTLNKGALV